MFNLILSADSTVKFELYNSYSLYCLTLLGSKLEVLMQIVDYPPPSYLSLYFPALLLVFHLYPLPLYLSSSHTQCGLLHAEACLYVMLRFAGPINK